MIYEHGKSWWNNVNRRKLLLRPPELSGNPTNRDIWQQVGETGEGKYEFGLASILSILASDFYTP
jgi:hypothetical protein